MAGRATRDRGREGLAAPVQRALLLMDGLERPRRPVQPEDHPAFRPVGELPIADRLLRYLASQGITEVAMAIQQLPGLLVHYFTDGAAWGVHIQYLYEQRPLGSGGALAQAAEFCRETTLVLAGSTLTDMPLAPFAAAHGAGGTLVTAVLGSVRGGRPRPLAQLDAEGYVVQYSDGRGEEAPREGLTDTGVYLMEPGVPARLARDTFLDWTRDVLPPLVQERQVRGWRSERTFVQVSSSEEVLLAEGLLGI